jgi:hypothetical protein
LASCAICQATVFLQLCPVSFVELLTTYLYRVGFQQTARKGGA